jgi:hypothetical protein
LWDFPKFDFIFFDDGPIKDAQHTQKNEKTLGVPTTN